MSHCRHLILYDGVCGLCDRLNRFVLLHDPSGLFCFASLQSGFGRSVVQRFGRDPDLLSTLYVVPDYWSESSILVCKARATLFVLKALGAPWRWAGLLGFLPNRALDWVYDLIALNRYRLFCRHEACLVPSAEYKSRFIEI